MDSTSPTGKTSIWKILGIIIGVLVVAFIGLMMLGGDYNKDGDAIHAKNDQILSQLKSGDFEGIYNDADPEFKKVSKKEDLQNLVKAFPILTTYTSSVLSKVKHDDTSATVEGTLNDASQHQAPYTMLLYKLGDAWKFYSLDIKNSPAPAVTDKTTGKEDTAAKIKDVRVGDGFDADGFAVSQKVITATASSIFVSVFTTQTADIMMTNVKIVHIATGDNVEQTQPIYKSTTVAQFNTRFQFTKPTNDWPKGKNKIVVTLANGDTKEVVYDIK